MAAIVLQASSGTEHSDHLLCEDKPWYILAIWFTYLWWSEQRNLDGRKSAYI